MDITSQTSQLQVINSEYPPLASMVNNGEKTEAYAYIVLEVMQLCNYFGEAWSAPQVQIVAREIYAQGYFLKVDELRHFAANCRAQKFGKMYGKFTPPILLEWLAEYLQQRLLIVEDQVSLAHDKHTASEKVMRVGRGKVSDEDAKIISSIKADIFKESILNQERDDT